ncbi:MAG: hypothetical protein OXB86_01320 [Bdellovibrionales bacterium]|nr:hypothetical protein [Bdellovibrionales bacterium]
MKGLKKIPNQRQLSRAYKALQFVHQLIPTKNLVFWSQWTRLDPRLGEILIAYLAKFWQKHNPVEINYQLKQQVWPAVFGALLEQVPFYYSQHLKNKKWNKKIYLQWVKCVMTDISPANDELFFIGLYKPSGKLMQEECLHSIKPYRQWGYFSKELLINKVKPVKKTLISAPQRKTIIDELLKSQKIITVQDYLEKINFQIHRRQAQRDLKNHNKLQAYGHTKNKYYKFLT